MKIALAQFNPTVGDFAGNSARILSLAAQAKQRGAELAVFSELCLCGYLPQDLLERSEEHTSELQSRLHLVCRLLLEKKKKKNQQYDTSIVHSRKAII